MSKYQITDSAQLVTLNNLLKDSLFISGNQPGAEDALVFEQFVTGNIEPVNETHVNLWSWYGLVSMFTPVMREQWKATQEAPKGGKPAKKEEAKPKKEEPKKEEEDDDDLFGDDGEDDAAALEAIKKKKDEEKKQVKKAGPIAKSLILLDVKVWDPEQNLDDLAAKIISIEKDGLFWKTEYKLEDVAFGVKKIVIGMVVEDEKVSVDDIIDQLESWEDDIQSVDIVCFNKI